MIKALFLAGPALGHIARLCSIAFGMSSIANVEVCFAVPEKSKHLYLINDNGFELLALKSEPGMPALETYSSQLEKVLASRDFDVIVQDLNPIQWTAAVVWPSIPRAVITNIFLAQQTDFETVQSIQFKKQRDFINALRVRKKLAALDTYLELYKADLVCFTDPKPIVDYIGISNDFQKACGACFWEIPARMPDELAGLSGFILASMGSTGRAKFDQDFMQKVARLASNNQFIYVGPEAPVIEGGAGIVCKAFDRLPLGALLAKASLAITQGGNGSTYQALSYGVPVVVVPSHRNQEILGEVLERLGVGISLPGYSRANRIDSFNLEVLRSKAQNFAMQMKLENGPKTAAVHILELLT